MSDNITPKAVAELDQAGAGLRSIARILAGMIGELKKTGVSPDKAAEVAMSLLDTVLWVNQQREDDDDVA